MIGRFELPNLEPDIKKMIFVSLAFHAAVILMFTVKMAFFPSDIPKYERAIRVDLIGLPDKRNPDKPLVAAKPEAPKAPETAETKTTPKKDAKKDAVKNPEPKATAASQSAALNKLKSLSAIEKLKAMSDKSKEKSNSAPQAETIKGNAISVGTSLKGLNKIDFDQYIGSLDTHIKNNWALPEWMLSQDLKAEVLIKIDKSGQIIEKRFIKKSGNSEFDERVMAALDKSNPFPAPPDKFADLVGIQGITFAFPE